MKKKIGLGLSILILFSPFIRPFLLEKPKPKAGIVITEPSRYNSANNRPAEEPPPRLMQDTFYEATYWKYHCDNKKPPQDGYGCRDDLKIDSSQVLFLSTSGDKKDCFIINLESSECGCYSGTSGSGFVFFKRKQDGSYYISGDWGFDLKQLKTAHNGVYDVAYYTRREPLEFLGYWDGQHFNSQETYFAGMPVSIHLALFKKYNEYPELFLTQYDTVQLSQTTMGIFVKTAADNWYIFEQLQGIDYQLVSKFDNWEDYWIDRLSFLKTSTNCYFDLIARPGSDLKKISKDTLCRYLHVWEWSLEKKTYQFSHKIVDTCFSIR
jgi:hypothetical protein